VPVPIGLLTEQHLAPFDVEDATRTYDDLRVVGRESAGAARRQQLNFRIGKRTHCRYSRGDARRCDSTRDLAGFAALRDPSITKPHINNVRCRHPRAMQRDHHEPCDRAQRAYRERRHARNWKTQTRSQRNRTQHNRGACLAITRRPPSSSGHTTTKAVDTYPRNDPRTPNANNATHQHTNDASQPTQHADRAPHTQAPTVQVG